ncbi:hypothetical protein Salmuc_05259 [Salipiger mucosus DSM 16094]|uniref:Mitochondrial inner membrane protein n=1 Tax=Salipiger mucosus DSM 16094 TaxID=1123237 RepID=S9RWW3_9RHOB|nr:hypothetical protein Salmuc_05259 [Salipiger mucosus DSM 16094]
MERVADEKNPVDGPQDDATDGADGRTLKAPVHSPATEPMTGTGPDLVAPVHNPAGKPRAEWAGAASADDTAGTDEDSAIFSVGEAEELKQDDSGEDSPLAVGEEPDRLDRGASATATGAGPQIVRETVVERKGGFFPVLLGGVIAAALGYGASAWVNQTWPFDSAAVPDTFEDDTRAALDEQTAQIETLTGRLDETTSRVDGIDLTPLENADTRIDEAVANLSEQLDAATGEFGALSARLDEFDSRLTALEKAPVEETVSPEAIAAYERELEGFREAMAEQRREVEAMTEEALAAEANAEEQASLAQSREALAEVNAALREGEPYATQLGALETTGVSIPEALSAPAADGVPTLAVLTEEFPPLAREALAAARRAESSDEDGAGRFATFLANQLGARSVTPREGDSADAILSRAEESLRAGDLPATLEELEALPEPSAEVLSDWMARATTRAEAIAAAQGVAQNLNEE